MPLSLRKKSAGFVGLDIDGAYLAAAQVSGGNITRAVSRELTPGLLSGGEVANPQALSEELREFFADHGLPRTVFLGVSNQHIAMRPVEMPRVKDQRELDAGVRFVAADVIPMPLEDAVLDYNVIGSSPGSRNDRIIVVAARRAMINAYLTAIRNAGLEPKGLDLDAFALVRMLGDRPEAEDVTRVYCHLAGITNFAVARGTSCLFTRPLSVAAMGEAVDRAHELAHEIQLSINSYMAQPDAQPVDEVVLSGPGSLAADLAETVGGRINLPVSVAMPLGALEADRLPSDEDPYRHTVSAGLALGAAA